MKSARERGPVGTWLRENRLARKWNDQETIAHLRDAGITVAMSTYREWEAGTRRPNERQLAQLVELYGTGPGPTAEPGLVEALAAQTDAITALVEELRLGRLAQLEATTVAFEALGSLGGRSDQRRGPTEKPVETAPGFRGETR